MFIAGGYGELMSVHFIGNLNSTPPFSYYQGNVYSGPRT